LSEDDRALLVAAKQGQALVQFVATHSEKIGIASSATPEDKAAEEAARLEMLDGDD
jgi:hypothetical protein